MIGASKLLCHWRQSDVPTRIDPDQKIVIADR